MFLEKDGGTSVEKRRQTMESALKAWRTESERRLEQFPEVPKDVEELLRFIGFLGDFLRADGMLDSRRFRSITREQIGLIVEEVTRRIQSVVIIHGDPLKENEEAAQNAGWSGVLCRRDWWQSILFFLNHWAIQSGYTMTEITMPTERALHVFDEKVGVLVRKACFDPLCLLYYRAVLALNVWPEPDYVRWDGATLEWPRVSNLVLPVIDNNLPSEMLVMFSSGGQFEKRIRAACKNQECAFRIRKQLGTIVSNGLTLHPVATKLFDELCTEDRTQSRSKKRGRR